MLTNLCRRCYCCAAEEKDLPKVLAGWGDWVGRPGLAPRKKQSAFEKELEAKRAKRRANRKPRQDDVAILRHVLINEKKNRKAEKYTSKGVPQHGYIWWVGLGVRSFNS